MAISIAVKIGLGVALSGAAHNTKSVTIRERGAINAILHPTSLALT